jgi:hypothetical protein
MPTYVQNLPCHRVPHGFDHHEKFTYSIVGFHGTGSITYREALAAVFMEGYVPSPLWSSERKFFEPFPIGGFSSSYRCSVFVNGSSVSCHSLSSSPSELV